MKEICWSAIRLPGNPGHKTLTPYCFVLRPGLAPDNRPRANFDGCVNLSKSFSLCFTLHSPSSHVMFPDIIRGDFGFPTIILRNSLGVFYHFARGNLKDFFDILRPNTPQAIRIPLAAFVYSRELKANPPDDGNFFGHPIERLTFDFLAHPAETIDIALGAICSDDDQEVTPQASDLIAIDRSGYSRQLPALSCESPVITLGFCLNSLGVALGLERSDLSISLLRGGNTIQALKISPSPETKYCGLKLPCLGPYTVDLLITKGAETVAHSRHQVCRMLSRRQSRRTILGVSDGFNYDAIAAVGGSWDRLPVDLRGLREAPSGFAFAPGSSPFPSTIPSRNYCRVMAPFAMPKWLSHKAEQSDYHRYGPSNWETYAKVVKAIVQEALLSGVTHYEVWNEASALGSWNDDMDTLVELHRVTNEAVKSVAPQMTVIGGFTHSWTFEFLRAFFLAGGGLHCDGLALHGYTYQPHEYVQQFDALDLLLQEFCADRPDFSAHITEIGFRHPTFSLHDQAQYLVLYTLEAASRSRVAALLYFRFQNPRPELLSTYRQNSSTGYAMVGYQGTYCRPSLAAFRFVERLLQHFDTISASGPWDCRQYQLSRGGSVEAVAIFQVTSSVGLPANWTEVDQYGEKVANSGTSGKLRFAVAPDTLEQLL